MLSAQTSAAKPARAKTRGSRAGRRLQNPLLSAWLLLLLRAQPCHGWEMRGELLKRGFDAEPSVLYRSLRDMEREGLVASYWADATTGPARRMYKLRARGRVELRELASGIELARRAHTAFLRAYRAAEELAS